MALFHTALSSLGVLAYGAKALHLDSREQLKFNYSSVRLHFTKRSSGNTLPCKQLSCRYKYFYFCFRKITRKKSTISWKISLICESLSMSKSFPI